MYDRQSVMQNAEPKNDLPVQEDLGRESAIGQSNELQPGGYTENHAVEDMPMFLNESEDPVVKDNPDGSGHKQIRYERTVMAHPTLSFADDDTMAVQASGHAKELFADDAVLNASEDALAGQESAVTLIKTGNSISVEGKALHQVKPALRAKGLDQAAEEVSDLAVDRCIALASRIGSNESEGTHTLAQRTDEGTERSKISVGSANSPEIDRLAIQLTREVEGRSLGEDEELPKDLGSTYGRMTQDPKFKEVAKSHGVNEFARPKVGDMLGIFSVYREQLKPNANPNAPMLEQMEQRKDFTEGGPGKSREFSWGYHYAGVVATSTEGADYVTLENYNRTSDMTAAIKIAVEELVQAKGGAIKQWYTQQRLKNLTPGKQLELLVKDKVGKNPEEVKRRLRDTVDAKHGEAWYFAMFGSKAGQSFHEKNAKSGYFANPLTVVTTSEDTRATRPSNKRMIQMPQPVGGGAIGQIKQITTEWRKQALIQSLKTPTVEAMSQFDKTYINQAVAVLAPDFWEAVLTAIDNEEVRQSLGHVQVGNLHQLSGALNTLYETLSLREDEEALTLLARPRIDQCTKLIKWATT